jgi:transcriptional regulator with XRE-family HTH domain
MHAGAPGNDLLPAAGRASPAVANLLRQRRIELGLTLREVQRKTEILGRPIPFTTVAKIESGRVDPGLKRLHLLFRLYDLPPGLASELLDLEEFAGEIPEGLAPARLLEEGLEHWKGGRLREALARLFALRARVPDGPEGRVERQKALLFFAVAVAQMGKFHLSRLLTDGLILEGPDPIHLVPALVQGATCWHSLGSVEMALALLARAELHLREDDDRNRAWVLHLRASVLVARHDLDGADAAIDRARQAYRSAGDLYGEGKLSALAFQSRFERGDFRAALALATAGREQAERSGYARLRIMRRIEEGRALLVLGQESQGIATLQDALAQSIGAQDTVMQFHAHYHLWKAHARRQDLAAAALELHAAQFHLRSVDEATPEAAEVRREGMPSKAGHRGARAG